MKIKYFEDTDTLYIEFRPGEVVETRNTVLDLDGHGSICPITIEHRKVPGSHFMKELLP